VFITLEGPDGSGKSTQARRLADWLQGLGRLVVLTREPGGTEIGDQIRTVIHDPRNTEMDPRTEILLYSASRAQHVAQRIRPALAAGKIVISDRYADSTYAYQGYGRGLDLDMLREITRMATGDLVPDLTIYIDLTPEEGLRRRRKSGGEWNRLDAEPLGFHCKVRTGYYELAASEPSRWVIVDGSASVPEVEARVRDLVSARLGGP
jgi:dTMP kinase